MENKDKEGLKENYEDNEVLGDDYPFYDLSFKVIVIGNSGVGKSCLSIKAVKNNFESHYLATVGFEFFTFNIKIGEKIIKLQIWDTCGQEIYRSLITNFYRNSMLAIVVYSIDDYSSFEDLEVWLKELKTHANPDIKIFLIGNKVDLHEKRQVPTELAEKFKDDYKLDLFLEASAKTGFNAKNILIEAAKILYQDYSKYRKNLELKKSFSDSISDKSYGNNFLMDIKNKRILDEKEKNSKCKC